ncbi:MAG: hypothetical protein GY716_20155 [bacterium]|nr:hypothetical protein [bacterium]
MRFKYRKLRTSDLRRRLARRAALSLLWLVVASSGPTTPATELFGPASINLPTGRHPTAIAAGDFDDDGLIDLAVANRDEHSVTILRGDGIGGFSPIDTVPLVGRTPAAVSAADLDDDGAMDLIVANSNSGSLSILLGDGSGGFRDPVERAVGGFPFSLAVGDLNRDGVDDVVFPSYFGGTLTLLAGDGDGGFLPLGELTVEGFPLFVTIDDVDGNGLPDLIYTDFLAPSVNVWLGNASGGFGDGNAASSITPVGSDPRWVAIDDFDDDGRRDLAVAAAGADTVSLLLGEGDGSFEADSVIDVAAGPRSIAVGDFDSNGSPDLAVVSLDADLLTVLINDGDGRLSRTRELSVGDDPEALIAAQLDRERSVDLAVVSGFNDAVRLMLGDGIGDFERAPEVAVGRSPTDTVLADLDGDDVPDIVTADFGGATLSILAGDGIGGFTPRAQLDVGQGPRAVAVAHFDDDDLADLAVANLLDDTVSILLADRRGGYTPSVESPIDVGGSPFALLARDLDGDGNADLVVANSSGASLGLLMGLGDGRFRVLDDLTLGADQGPWSIAAADFDGDERIDLVAATTSPPRLDVFRGTGDANRPFDPVSTLLEPDRSPFFVAAGDIDLDGDPDLITVDRFDDSVSVRLNDGDGDFTLIDRVAVGPGPSEATLGDLNADGLPDLAVAGQLGDAVTILLGDGTGRLVRDAESVARNGLSEGSSVHPDLSVARAPIGIVSGDIDRDGHPDLIVSCSGSDTVSLLLNRLDERADPNGSNRIDGFDISEIGRRIGKNSPDAEYLRRTDIDINGIIDGFDLTAAASRFGELQREVSLLRAELSGGGSPGPGTVTLSAVEAAGDTLTLALLADAGGERVAAADFSLTFEPESGSAQVLELIGFRPGDCVSGGLAQINDVVDTTPGRVTVTIGTLPPEAVPCDGAELIRLVFRARRAGSARLEFGALGQSGPSLIGLDPEGGGSYVIDGVSFVSGAGVTIEAGQNGPPAQRIGVTPEALDFGAVGVEESERRSLRISNFGFSDLTVSRVAVFRDCAGEEPAPEFATRLNEAVLIPAFGYVELPVFYSPATAGESAGALRIDSDDPLQGTICVPLTGLGSGGS